MCPPAPWPVGAARGVRPPEEILGGPWPRHHGCAVRVFYDADGTAFFGLPQPAAGASSARGKAPVTISRPSSAHWVVPPMTE